MHIGRFEVWVKQTLFQQFITANCEDLLRDVFCVGEDFQFDQNSIKAKFSELGASNVKGKNTYRRADNQN